MSLTTKVLLNKVRQKQDGSYPLVIRVTYHRKVIYIPLGYALKESDFDAKNQLIKTSSKVASNITRLNKQITSKVRDVYDTISKLEEEGVAQTLTLKEIKQRITGTEDQSTNVFYFIDEVIQELVAAKKYGNATVYKTLKNKLKSFVGNDQLTFSEITYKFLKKLETAHYAGGAGLGSLSVYMRTLRATYNRAIKAGVANNEKYPFNDYKIKNQKPRRKALSEADFETLQNAKLEKGSAQEQARDLFMASFYLRGMNWMDMAYLRGSNIKGNFERLQYVRRKTGEPFSIKIHPKLRDLLERYLGPAYGKDDFVFPILSKELPEPQYTRYIRGKRERLNRRLRKIAEDLEIEPFSIYAARHTYATMGKRRGVPTAVIQEGLGHATESMTQTYLDSFENKVVDDYDELIMGE